MIGCTCNGVYLHVYDTLRMYVADVILCVLCIFIMYLVPLVCI